MGNLSGLELAIMIVSGLIVVGLVVALIVQIVLIVKYKKYNKTPLANGLTSQQTARSLLDANGLQNVEIKKYSGTFFSLSDSDDGRLQR